MVILSPKSDIGAKGIFRNETVRKYFISDVLGIPADEIKSVKLLNTFLHRWRYQKQGILDILIELNNHTKINIEIQVRAWPLVFWTLI